MNRAVGLLLARGWMNFCAIGSFLIVGRFLSPTEFGIYALASSGIMLPMTLIGAGFADHVISRDHDKKDEATAYWATAAIGLAFTLLALIAAFALPFVGLAAIGNVLLVLSPLPLLWGFSAILEAMLIRDDRAGTMAAYTMAAETIGLIALIGGVLMGMGVMSLAVSRLANNGLLLVIYWVLVRPPALNRVTREATGRLTRFSLGVIGARIMNWIDSYGVEFVIGSMLPTALVGFYRMAGRLSASLSAVLIFAPWQAQLSYLGERIKAAPHRAGVALLRAFQLHMSLIAPPFIGLAVLAQDVVHLLLGPSWADTGEVLGIMSATAPLLVVYGVFSTLLIAKGKTRRLFYVQVFMVACTTAALALGATGGLVSAALAKFFASALVFSGAVFFLAELSGAQRVRIARYFAALTLSCFALAAAMHAVTPFLPQGGEIVPSLVRIIVSAIVGLIAYVVALRFTDPQAVRLLLLVARRRLRKRAAPTLQQAAQES